MLICLFVHLESQWTTVAVSHTGRRRRPFCININLSFLSITLHNKMLNKLKNTIWACPFNGTENRTKSVFLIMGCLLWKIIIVKTHQLINEKFTSSLHWSGCEIRMSYSNCLLGPIRFDAKPDTRFIHTFELLVQRRTHQYQMLTSEFSIFAFQRIV